MHKHKELVFIAMTFLNLVVCNPLFSFSLSASSNRVKLNQTLTINLDVSPGVPGGYTYQWSSNKGSITGSGNIVAFNAPGTKGKATISVTVTPSGGGSSVWSGSISAMVFKKIFLIECDDYWNDNGQPNGIRQTWKDYCDFMISTHMKFAVAAASGYIETANTSFVNLTQSYIDSGYMEIMFHGVIHDCGAEFGSDNSTQQTATFNSGINTIKSKFGGYTLHGFNSPCCIWSADTVTAINSVSDMKYWMDTRVPPGYTKVFITNYALIEPTSNTPDYAYFVDNYNARVNDEVTPTYMHPPWWSNPTALNTWKQTVAFLRSQNVTVILPYEYYRMLTEPAFVADESPGGGDTTAPVISAEAVSNLTNTSARITWTTDEGATSQVDYWSTTGYGNSTTLNSSLVTSHTVDITGLTAGTLYHYRVKSTDSSSNAAVGAEHTFATSNTGGSDTTPPGAPSSVRDGTGNDVDSASLTTQLSANWTAATDAQSAITNYQYAIGTTPGATDVLNWTGNNTGLNVTKTGLNLTVGQIYYFSVRAVSAGGTGPAANSNGQIVTESASIPGLSPVYPNPYSLSVNQQLTFPVSGGTVKEVSIYTLGGRLVRKLSGAGEIKWDGKNESGEMVIRGIYMYNVSDESGNTLKGKFAIVR